MKILETSRLLLRRFQQSDAAALMLIFGDEEVMRFGPGVQTEHWVLDWLRKCHENYDKRGYGPWAAVEKATGETIGYCGLFYFPDINGQPEVEIGYRLARRHWANGYATEAVTAIKDYGLKVIGLPRLIAIIDPSNVASIRVAEKAGMRYEADVLLEGYTYPDRVYVVAKEAEVSD